MGEGKERKGEEERLCPLPPLQSLFPSLSQMLESPIPVAVNAQLTPSCSPNILQNVGGGDAARKGYLRQMGHYTP